MGTLFDQPPRQYHRGDYFDVGKFLKLSKEHGVPLRELIELWRVAEYARRTDVMVDDFDTKDEQLAGLGEILRDLLRRSPPNPQESSHE